MRHPGARMHRRASNPIMGTTEMTKLRILVVDDDEDFAVNLTSALDLFGHRVRWVSTGGEAIDAWRESSFDIGFMDVGLPDRTGVDSFLKIRSFRPQARIVLMTGGCDEALLDQARENGAVGVLIKPFPFGHLARFLDRTATVDQAPSSSATIGARALTATE